MINKPYIVCSMNTVEQRFLYAKIAKEYFDSKVHTFEYEEYAGNKLEFKTYEVQVAVFGDDFDQSPVIKSLRVRLSNEEYLRLLQWQLQNPATGFNACDGELCDIIGSIEYQVEDKVFGDAEVGTYAIHLSEIRRDAASILRALEDVNQ